MPRWCTVDQHAPTCTNNNNKAGLEIEQCRIAHHRISQMPANRYWPCNGQHSKGGSHPIQWLPAILPLTWWSMPPQRCKILCRLHSSALMGTASLARHTYSIVAGEMQAEQVLRSALLPDKHRTSMLHQAVCNPHEWSLWSLPAWPEDVPWWHLAAQPASCTCAVAGGGTALSIAVLDFGRMI
jgi:hypothetical protein